MAEVELEKKREREARKRAGLDTEDIDKEDVEDYMGVGPLIEKVEKERLDHITDWSLFDEPTDSDSEDEDDRFSQEAIHKRSELFERKFDRFEEMLKSFSETGIVIFIYYYYYYLWFIC